MLASALADAGRISLLGWGMQHTEVLLVLILPSKVASTNNSFLCTTCIQLSIFLIMLCKMATKYTASYMIILFAFSYTINKVNLIVAFISNCIFSKCISIFVVCPKLNLFSIVNSAKCADHCMIISSAIILLFSL